MQGKAYVERLDGGVRFAETDERGRLVRYLFLTDGEPVGRIYRGKVERVTGAGSFVDIGREKHGFLSTAKRAGDYVTVVVTRGEEDQKGCRLTENLSVAGKYVVVNDGTEKKFSRKSKLDGETKKYILSEVGGGAVFRTAVTKENAEEAIAEEAELRAKLNEISKAENLYEIKLLYAPDILTVAENMSDLPRGDFSEIEEQISALGERKVEVNGVELVFDETEAMTVIDVNSHLNTAKFTDADSFAYATDLIAAEEACRQIRLRNIGGLIAVDFVSIRDKDKINALKARLDEALRRDDVTAKADFSDRFCVALISRLKRYL